MGAAENTHSSHGQSKYIVWNPSEGIRKHCDFPFCPHITIVRQIQSLQGGAHASWQSSLHICLPLEK